MKKRTLFDKIWDSHVVVSEPDCPSVFYIDLHLIHEVTSPQAFQGLRERGLKVRRPDRTVATMDHIVPTRNQNAPIADPLVSRLVTQTGINCREFGIALYGLGSPYQGIVHVIGPELGLTQPGMTIVCGDSHTSTHGAFGALAFGIGTSEVEHVLATQCLPQNKPRTMFVRVQGKLSEGVTAKDLALGIIGKIGTDGASGHVIEYAGEAVRALSMEGRMTLCNMSIEAGARAGMIAPDETTISYLKGRRFVPRGDAWDEAEAYWRTLPSDGGAQFDCAVEIDAAALTPFVTWGTSPGMVAPINGIVPDPLESRDEAERRATRLALEYMALQPRTKIADIAIDRVFIGSCTNSRMEDLRAEGRSVKGHRRMRKARAMSVPASHTVKRAA